MAPTSPHKPDARRSRSRLPLYSFSGSIRHQVPVVPRPSQRPSRCQLPQAGAVAKNPPTGHLNRPHRLGRSSPPIRSTRRSTVPRPKRSNAAIVAGIDRSLRSHPGVLDQSQEPPAPVNSKYRQSPYTPLPSISSKRPHPVDVNSDSRYSHGSPRKRHCLVHQGVYELSHPVTTAIDLLPQFPSIDDAVTCPSRDKFGDEFPKEDQPHSSWPLASTRSDTAISSRKQKDDRTRRRSTSARATEEHNQLDQSTRSIEHQARPLFKRPGDDRLLSEKFDAKSYQKLKSPQHTAVGNLEGSPHGELANPNELLEPKKPSRDKRAIPKNPSPTTTTVLEGWPLVFACLAAFIGGMFFPDLRVPEFRAVDWNERAIELDIALATIPRVVLFGEASLSQQRLQPGMLPVDGLAHDHNPSFGPHEAIPVRSKWFSNSTEFPPYEPWLTTSTGVFVPELTFLEDLQVVTMNTCLDVGSIPIPDGSSPSDEFFILLSGVLGEFDTFYIFEESNLGFHYTDMSVGMNLVMLNNMVTLQQMQRNGSEELGSDQLRARELHASTATTVSLPTAEPPSPRRLPTDTSIPDDILESFINGWQDAMAARSSRFEQEHASTSTPTIDTIATKIPKPSDYAKAQLNNGTANLLVEYVIDVVVGRRLNETDEAEGPTYGNIIDLSTRLDKLCDLFLQLNNHVSKVIRFANKTKLRADQFSRLQRIQDTAPFLRDIAAPRLGSMQARAKRGVQLLKETEKRQAELQDEIERTLRNGWLAPGPGWLSRRIIYYYLPDLKSMALQWSYARQWLAVELEEVFEVYQGRQAEFRLRRTGPPSNLSKRQIYERWGWQAQVVWSRWSLEDIREDPEGKELFCWSLREWQPSASIWQRIARWVKGRDDDDIPPPLCGDASRRHG